jgi:NOL1/NOP2/fmu family ribosome biogenesis protein
VQVPDVALDAWNAFCGATLTAPPAADLLLTDQWLFAARMPAPDVSGLRALRPGWHLGSVRRGRLAPGHALALGLGAGDVQRTLELASDGPEVLRYLRGETMRTSLADGWALVTVDGFSLGWAKVVRGVAKNHYPKALRWLWR